MYDYKTLIFSIIITAILNIAFPLVLRLTSKSTFDYKQARNISIINAIVIAIIFLLLSYNTDSKISFFAAFFWGGINLYILQKYSGYKDYTIIFMVASVILLITGYFIAAIPCGAVAAIISWGGIRISSEWKRNIFYITGFLGVFEFSVYLYASIFTTKFPILYGIVSATTVFAIFYILMFKDYESTNKTKTRQKSLAHERYCKMCGEKLDSNNYCSNCDRKYFTFSYKSLSLIMIILNIILIVGCVYYYKAYDISTDLLANTIAKSALKVDELNDELDSLNGIYSTDYTENKLNFFDDNIVFVIEGYGNYYYTYDCMLVKVSGNYSYRAYNINAAESIGYKKGSCSIFESIIGD